MRSTAARELLARDGLRVTVADARWAKPLDAELILELATDHALLVTIEENVLAGGFGSGVAELLLDSDRGGDVRLVRIGLPDRFVTHGAPAFLHEEVGLTPAAIAQRVRETLGLVDAPLITPARKR